MTRTGRHDETPDPFQGAVPMTMSRDQFERYLRGGIARRAGAVKVD